MTVMYLSQFPLPTTTCWKSHREPAGKSAVGKQNHTQVDMNEQRSKIQSMINITQHSLFMLSNELMISIDLYKE